METPAQNYASRVKAILEHKDILTVMFVGAPGAGKSSLITSLIYLLDSGHESPQEDLDRCVRTAPPNVIGHNTMLEPFKLTDTITIVDNRGWHDQGNKLALQELVAQTNGKRSYDDDATWNGDVHSSTVYKSLAITDRLDCTKLVLSVGGGTTSTHSSFGLILFAVTLFLALRQSMGQMQWVIVLQGDTATLQFNTSWQSTSSPDAIPYFTLRFDSMMRPFCVDGMIDPPALLHKSQYDRFTVVPQRNSDYLEVKLIIQDVNIHDVGYYILTFLLLRSDGEFDTTEAISLQITVTPGKAECFIMMNDSGILWHEVHCNAIAGSGNATVSCFQDHNKVPYKGEVVRNGEMIRGIFWMISSNPMYCCSHEWKEGVTQDSCLDFVFPSQPNLTTAAFDTPKSSEASATKDHLGRRSTEYIQVEPLAERSFASRAYQTVTPCIILASLILYSQR